MSFAKAYSALPAFPSTILITIEADLSRGLHSFNVVGLPDKAVEESRDRVSAAIKHAGFASPKTTNHKIVVSLAPAHIKKEGPQYDLPIAVAYLAAAGEIVFEPEGKLILGELSLDGLVRPVRGVLAAACYARDHGFKEIFVPYDNAAEASFIDGITVYPVRTLRELANHLSKDSIGMISPQEHTAMPPDITHNTVDFIDIRGQESAKRGLEIAAAGRHNIVLYGPPGTGKTMLARAFTGILPSLSFDEAIEVTAIHSIAGTLDRALITTPPLRAPHHSASHVSLIGGGTTPRPGEITLAHRGVLFLVAVLQTTTVA